MSKFVQIALAWLLAFALPVQGYAAQAMLLCGPAHHATAASAQDQATEASHAAHASHGAAMAASDTSSDHQGNPGKSGKSSHAGKCSAGSSCCGAVAITTATLSIEVSPQPTTVVATIATGKTVETLGGLDRPPRSDLA